MKPNFCQVKNCTSDIEIYLPHEVNIDNAISYPEETVREDLTRTGNKPCLQS